MKRKSVEYKKLLQSNYKDASRKVKQRKDLLSELKLLGDAFAFVVVEKERLSANARVKPMPPLPIDLALGVYGETDYMLCLVLGSGTKECQTINLIRCHLPRGNAYPCEIHWDGGKGRCKSMKELRVLLNEVSKRILIGVLEKCRAVKSIVRDACRGFGSSDFLSTNSPPGVNPGVRQSQDKKRSARVPPVKRISRGKIKIGEGKGGKGRPGSR